MGLTLITGPANAEKARRVLDGLRAAAAYGRAPVLVVPTAADVAAYRRELAGDGVLLGVTVTRFDGLLRLMAIAGGSSDRVLSKLGAERAAAAAVRAAGPRLGVLRGSAATVGFPAALARLAGELGDAGVSAARFGAAMRSWAAEQPARAAYAADLAALYGAYERQLDDHGRPDNGRYARRVADALRLDPGRWGAQPVFLYGFDDLTASQRDAVETLARIPDTEIVVSLPYEPGRVAFAGRGESYATLSSIAGPGSVERLEAQPEHYAPESRAALHGLERELFEASGAHVDPGSAIELLEGGGARAELELVAERVLELLERGVAAHEIAIALRDARESAPLVASVFREAGIPIALDQRIRAEHTGLGRALLALLRCAALGGGAADLLVWLRAPGIVTAQGRLERLERDLRRAAVTELAAARAAWRAIGGFELDAIDQLAAAQRAGTAALCRALATQVRRLLGAPWRSAGRGAAPVLGEQHELDARAATELLRTLSELGELAERSRSLAAAPEELYRHLAGAELRAGSEPAAGLVTVASPLQLRARRVRVLFLGRLCERLFPRPGRPEPFLGDAERSELAGASGLVLRERETTLDEERYLLYAAISRPAELLVLSWHVADDDGAAVQRSPFVDDVLDCLLPRPPVRVRALGEIGVQAASPAHSAASAPAGALRDAAVLADIAARDSFSATEIETHAQCPVRWYVERLLRPAPIDPDAQPLSRGSLIHAVLERTYAELGELLTASSLPRALELMRAAFAELEAGLPLAPNPHRRRAERLRVEADLARYLTAAAGSRSGFRPARFELGFGLPEAAQIAPGLALRGSVDRVDLSPDGRHAIVVDYKGRSAKKGQQRWLEDGTLQAGLYALAVEALEPGLEVVGALYQPIGADDEQAAPRGFVLADQDTARTDVRATDRIDAERRAELLDGIRDQALEVVRGLRAGELVPRPESCGWNGSGCSYPSICRCER